MTKKPRAARREEERQRAKLARDLERLASLAPGGAPDRPLVLTSPSEVEVRARARPCPVCGGEVRVVEHTAETIAGARLRVATVSCNACGRRRAVYFQLQGAALN